MIERRRPARAERALATTSPTIVNCLELVPTDQLKLAAGNLRSRGEDQVREMAKSISTFGFIVPIVADGNDVVWAGAVRLKASQKLGLSEIPVVRLSHLSETQKRAFRLADNKLYENGKWDRQALAVELPELRSLLIEEGLEISVTGFSAAEIDQITVDFEQNPLDPADEGDVSHVSQPAVSVKGSEWRLGRHVLCCGDARDEVLIRRLAGNNLAAMAFMDVPYNVRVRTVVGRGRTKHLEFAMASGEMTPDRYEAFLKKCMTSAAAASLPSAAHYWCTDWRHIESVARVGREAYSKMLNLAVWVKTNAGQGSFLRSQHELIAIFRVGEERHLNNVQLGRHGRSRSNVWQYPGGNTFRTGRMDDLRAHPTVKPIALVCDAIKDCTRLDDTILDFFCGSGTTLLAAERVGRRAVCMDIEPRFVDLTIRRWQGATGNDAIHVPSGRTFNAMASTKGPSGARTP